MDKIKAIFTALLDTQTEVTQLKEMQNQQSPAGSASIASSQNNMVNMSPFEAFDQSKEKFSQYLDRFDHYHKLKKVTNDDQKMHLLSVSTGSEHYNNLVIQLQGQKSFNDLKFSELVDSLKQLLTKKRSEVVAQYYFLNVKQENQTIMQFVSSLKKDLSDCNFSATCECRKSVAAADLFLRCQFIRGLKDQWMRQQLIHLDLSKFDNFVSKAVALEASQIESKEIGAILPATTTRTTVDLNQVKVSRDKHDNDEHLSRVSNNPYNKSARSNRYLPQNQSHSPSYSHRMYNQSDKNEHADFRELGIDGLCLNSACPDHFAHECPCN